MPRNTVNQFATLPLGILVINGYIGILKDMDGKEYVHTNILSRTFTALKCIDTLTEPSHTNSIGRGTYITSELNPGDELSFSGKDIEVPEEHHVRARRLDVEPAVAVHLTSCIP